jgi:hypothetical protein
MDKALHLFDTPASLHEIELYMWLLNNRLYILAESLYSKYENITR